MKECWYDSILFYLQSWMDVFRSFQKSVYEFIVIKIYKITTLILFQNVRTYAL